MLTLFKITAFLLVSHLPDSLQIHRIYNNLIIIRHKLFIDRMVKRPRLLKETVREQGTSENQFYHGSSTLYIVSSKKEQTHIKNHHHFLSHDVVQDEGKRHLVVIIQKGVDRFLQPHQPILFLPSQAEM